MITKSLNDDRSQGPQGNYSFEGLWYPEMMSAYVSSLHVLSYELLA
jgi:hypothetical protein